ncbi:hypothetical protein ACKAV7_006979 [Fusarium commune]
MGTVYAPFQQATQQPLGDGTQPFDPDMSLMTQDQTGMNLCGTFPQGSWEQWWSPEDIVFAESANKAAPNVYAQQQPQHSTYSYDEDDSAQRTSLTTSMHSYPLPSPSSESTSIDVATSDSFLILNGHKSHHSANFRRYCQDNKIITLCIPAYSSRLL